MTENSDSSRDNSRGSGRFRLVLIVGVLVGAFVARRLAAPRRMPFLGLWQRALAGKRGEAEAARLAALAQARYDELYAGRSRLSNRALRIHLERSILPGLALYQTLLEEGDDRQTALAEMEHMMASTVSGIRGLMSFLGRLPEPFAIFRRIEPWVIRLWFPAEGWEMEPVEESEDCIAFNVHRCFYVDTLRSYGAPELTPVYCGGDDVVFPALAPAITWERPMTLGRGHDHCDFRWCRATVEGAKSAPTS